MLKYFSLLTLILLIFSCQIIDMSDIEVTIYPSERNQIIEEDDIIWIEFSENIGQTEAEGFIQLLGPEGIVEGDLTWQDKRLRLRPYEDLTRGFRYNFKFQGMINTIDGRNYQIDKNIPFYAGTDSSKAILVSFTPESGTITSAFDPIAFNFSKELDTNSFEQNFTINPSADLDFFWENDNSKVTVTAEQKWTNQKLHQWKIPAKVTDTDQIQIAMEYSKTFLVQLDVTPPQILNIQPTIKQNDGTYLPLTALGLTDIENNNDIYFQFDDSIDFASLNSSFSIKPDLDGHLKQISPQEFVYIKGDNFVPAEEHTITFKEGLQDISGNSIPEDIVYNFIPDVPAIQVQSIEIKHKNGNLILDDTDFNSSDLIGIAGYEYFGADPDYILNFVITLDQQFSSSEITAKQNFVQGISCETTFPESVSSPFQYSSSWTSENVLSIQFIAFEIASDDEPVYYRFKILGGSISSANLSGSYLLEDVYFYFNAQGMTP